MKKIIVILSILSFLLIGWIILIFTNNINWFDNLIYEFLFSLKGDNFTLLMQIITKFSNLITIIVLAIIIGLIGLYWKRKESLYLILSIIVSSLTNVILKIFFQRIRPEHYRFIDESGYSFPSGHAMASMVFYGSLIIIVKNAKIRKKYKYLLNVLFSILIILIGVSRIYLGVHYPSDIIGGWLIASMILLIENELIKRRLL